MTKVFRKAAADILYMESLPKVNAVGKIGGENIAQDIMGSHWCILCYPKKKKHAYFIYSGNSLCEKHFKERLAETNE